jgi:hypothetical protein
MKSGLQGEPPIRGAFAGPVCVSVAWWVPLLWSIVLRFYLRSGDEASSSETGLRPSAPSSAAKNPDRDLPGKHLV